MLYRLLNCFIYFEELKHWFLTVREGLLEVAKIITDTVLHKSMRYKSVNDFNISNKMVADISIGLGISTDDLFIPHPTPSASLQKKSGKHPKTQRGPEVDTFEETSSANRLYKSSRTNSLATQLPQEISSTTIPKKIHNVSLLKKIMLVPI